MSQLSMLRQQINTLDDQLLQLIVQRTALAQQVRQAKRDRPTYRPGREAAIIRRMQTQAPTLAAAALQTIYSEIIGLCRNAQQPLRIAYLGPAGSYSHAAAAQLAGSSSIYVPAESLTDVLRAAERGAADVALLPLENSTEGMVLETHRLLLGTPLVISREMTLPIRHALLSKAAPLDEIKTVHAHPQALGQCRQWLRTYLPQAIPVPAASNSYAADLASRTPYAAAIAGEYAARLYHLDVVAQSISDEPANQTRFVLLGPHAAEPTGDDKTSVIFTTKNRPGQLAAVLELFAKRGINLLRIASQPATPSEYAFFIDAEGHQSDEPLSAALDHLAQSVTTYKYLGSYPKGT